MTAQAPYVQYGQKATYTANDTLVIPSGCTSIRVKAWGGVGATFAAAGGGGGFAQADIAVTAGDSVLIRLGGVGGDGGNYAGVFITSETFSNAMLIAGGGGAGGDSDHFEGSAGGAGGGTTGDYGGANTTRDGKGGTPSAGGAAGTGGGSYGAGTAGGQLTGGAGGIKSVPLYENEGRGGDGGNGYYGGGGGSGYAHTSSDGSDFGHGGGGGSSYTGGASGHATTNVINIAGVGADSANTGDADYPGSTGVVIEY